MEDDEENASLEALEARIAQARRKRPDASPPAGDADGFAGNAMGMAFRIGVELVSAFAVAVGIGWLLDRWLGTRPWMMVAFFFLGAGAGILNVYRTVNSLGLAVGYRRPGEKERDGEPEA